MAPAQALGVPCSRRIAARLDLSQPRLRWQLHASRSPLSQCRRLSKINARQLLRPAVAQNSRWAQMLPGQKPAFAAPALKCRVVEQEGGDLCGYRGCTGDDTRAACSCTGGALKASRVQGIMFTAVSATSQSSCRLLHRLGLTRCSRSGKHACSH